MRCPFCFCFAYAPRLCGARADLQEFNKRRERGARRIAAAHRAPTDTPSLRPAAARVYMTPRSARLSPGHESFRHPTSHGPTLKLHTSLYRVAESSKQRLFSCSLERGKFTLPQKTVSCSGSDATAWSKPQPGSGEHVHAKSRAPSPRFEGYVPSPRQFRSVSAESFVPEG
jgi:hypothetical protein